MLDRTVAECLEAARLGRGSEIFPKLVPGLRVLVKPNLLMKRDLACTSPKVVAAVCAWLADYGVRVTVADSPGFGRGTSVASFIGLEEALRPLGLSVEPMDRPMPVELETGSGSVRMSVSRRALECDVIFSVPRVKAHSQMLLTLSVKNCFGMVCGYAKAIVHARHGASVDMFASCLAALWAWLPPVAGVADGITAMHVTGPAKGASYHLNMLAASAFAPALDAAICSVLGVDYEDTPLGRAISACPSPRARLTARPTEWTLQTPEHFSAHGFILPRSLESASFSPARLAKSFLKRLLADIRR